MNDAPPQFPPRPTVREFLDELAQWPEDAQIDFGAIPEGALVFWNFKPRGDKLLQAVITLDPTFESQQR